LAGALTVQILAEGSDKESQNAPVKRKTAILWIPVEHL